MFSWAIMSHRPSDTRPEVLAELWGLLGSLAVGAVLSVNGVLQLLPVIVLAGVAESQRTREAY